ncbi:MAG: SRPBCC domain-containing protein [Ignavibacteria bacterium]|nr:SRPBCC domain-containing protein [Ignavibacteria bacterium]
MSEKESTRQKELTITRTFDAPIELVWRAWAEPEHFKKWWGPKGYICPDCIIDFRVEGKYHTSMMDEKGNKIWTTGIYQEIIPQRKIVYTDSFADENGNVVSSDQYGMPGVPLEMIVTVTLEEANGKTKMSMTHTGLPDDHMKGANTGWNTSFDKLAESLKK